MESLSFGTAGLLFPAITMLMLAYTQRFLGLASIARRLVASYRSKPEAAVWRQLQNLSLRLSLLRHVQALGALALALCVACFIALFVQQGAIAAQLFMAALLAMLASLLVSLAEIHLSMRALKAVLETSRIRAGS